MTSRKCRTATTVYVNSDLDDMNDVSKDPYHDSDDGQDPNFEPQPPKKIRHSKKVIPLKKGPTRRERLERLNRISQKYNSKTNLSKSPNAILPNSSNQRISNDDDDSNNALANYDVLFIDDVKTYDVNENAFSRVATHSQVQITEQQSFTPVPAPTSAQPQNDLCPLVDMVLDLQGKISDLNNNVMLLRKQVSRVELKTIGWPIGLDGRAHVISNGSEEVNAVGSEDLLDLESLLAREGLPKTTCIEINDLEARLRSDNQYRTKLVRNLFARIYFCI